MKLSLTTRGGSARTSKYKYPSNRCSKKRESHADESSRGRGEMKPEMCESQLDDVSKRVPIVRFLLEALEKAGCPIKRSFFEVEHCTQAVMGGFKPGGGVVLCHNNLNCRTDIENMLAHELVHAYDHCRNKNMNWMDLKQHACSEVRASNLSGDCHWYKDEP